MGEAPLELSLHVVPRSGGIRGTVAGPYRSPEPFDGWLELTARIARALEPDGEGDSGSGPPASR